LARVPGKGDASAEEPGKQWPRNARRRGDAAAKGQGGLQVVFTAGKKVDAKALQLPV